MNDAYDFATSAIELRLIAQEKAANASYMENILLELEEGMHREIGDGEPLVGMRAAMAQERRTALIVGQVCELLIDLAPREPEVRGAARSMRSPLTARAATADERAFIARVRDDALAFLRARLARFSKLDRWPTSPLRPWKGRGA